MMNDLSTTLQHIDNGVRWLDATIPGWADKLDVETFDISHCLRCVLGQLYGNYAAGAVVLELSHQARIQYGFCVIHTWWADANVHWRAAIRQRQERLKGEAPR